ncbi:MAG: hypothetical protein ABH816_03155 [Candidatus Levyibacteriota bacterium]
MAKKIREIKGANMDIDFTLSSWKHGECPWGKNHKCAVKNVSICDHFEGVKKLDTVLCSYPDKKS